MWNFLKPAPHKDLLPEGKIDSTYKSLRWQVFVGIFIGYAGYYIVRKNFSMAMPFLTDPAGPYGFDKGSLSIVLSLNAVAYALSKFLMGSVSDRSNARVFLPLGLALAALSMMFMAVPIELFGASTTSIVIMAVLRKLVPDRTDRLKYACMVIIAANAGGSWSPIGDVTTILLWVGKNISAMHQISHVFIPALVNMLVPLTIAHFWLFKKGSTLRVLSEEEQGDEYIPEIPNRSRRMIFVIGVLSLALVPVFQMVTNLPPFLGVLLGLVILWFYTDLMYSKLHMHESQKLRISQLLPNIDLATIFFFLGILMAVGALETSGQLGIMSAFLDKHVHEPYLISFVIGALSSCVDNVALVAATMGMYPIVEQVVDLSPYAQFFVSDGGFWTFLAYCAVTGGSILIIGSATGVTVMGLEKIDFMYYTKRFSILALIGYCCGAGVYMLLFA